MNIESAKAARHFGRLATNSEWKKLGTMPGYINAVMLTNITNVFLKPTACS